MCSIEYERLDEIRKARPHRDVPYSNMIIPLIVKTISDYPKQAPYTEEDAINLGNSFAQELITERLPFAQFNYMDTDNPYGVNPENRLNSRAREMFLKYGISYDHEIQRVKDVAARTIATLPIPLEAQVYLINKVEQISFKTDSYNLSTEHEADKVVRLAPFLSLYEAETTSGVFRQELQRDLLRGVIVNHAGHEIGHIIDALTFPPAKSKFDCSAAVRYGDNYMTDFPIKYIYPEEDDWVAIPYKTMKGERFANYFAKDILEGMGFRSEIYQDLNRRNLEDVFACPYNPWDIGVICSFARGYLLDLEAKSQEIPNHQDLAILARNLGGFIVEDVFSSHALAALFPFPKSAAADILTSAWQEYQKSVS